jgi:Tfp pilus assembly protein PilO
MKNMNFLVRHDTRIAIVGTAMLTAGYYFGIASPGRAATRKLEAEIAQAQAKVGEIPVILAERSHLQLRVEKERGRLEQMDLMLPEQSHVSEVLHQVASQAQRSGLAITRLEPLPSVDFASYSAHPFHLSCRGTFADISGFLGGLETQPRLVTFGSVKFSRGADGSAPLQQQTIQANIDFNVYSRHAKTTKVAENASSRGSVTSDN